MLGGGTTLLLLGDVGIYTLLCIVKGKGSVWYSTCFAFPIGMYVAIVEKQQHWREMKLWKKVIIIVAFITVTACVVLRYLPYSLSSTISSICLGLLLSILLDRYKFSNKYLSKVGDFSWEFYLCHTKILYITMDRFESKPLLWFISAFIVSLIIGWLFHVFIEKTVRLIIRRRVMG